MMYPGHEETVDSHDVALTGFVPVTESPSKPAFWGQSEKRGLTEKLLSDVQHGPALSCPERHGLHRHRQSQIE
jgi:hypothetical protein